MSEEKSEDLAAAERARQIAEQKAAEALLAAEKAELVRRRAVEVAEAKAHTERAQAQADATADALDGRIDALPKAFADLFELLKASSTKGRTEHGHLDYTVSFVQHVEAIAAEASAWIKRTV